MSPICKPSGNQGLAQDLGYQLSPSQKTISVGGIQIGARSQSCNGHFVGLFDSDVQCYFFKLPARYVDNP
jgi:hypothetical protein